MNKKIKVIDIFNIISKGDYEALSFVLIFKN